MKDKKIYILIGTRPNFIKVTQFKKCAVNLYPNLKISIIHTGQHYDEKMADVFFKQFNLIPDYYLNISPASANKQIAEIMIKLEDLVNDIGKPDLLLVPGDVNSTLAGALFANKSGIKLGHIEAGLRSFDKTMPEEHNRILTDNITDLFFLTEPSGMKHLKDEGKDDSKIYFVGNTMIDTMVAFEKEIETSSILNSLGINESKFVLMTMHRPATVDNKVEFEKLIELIDYVSINYKVVFAIHPRTIKNAKEFGLYDKITNNKNLICTEPLDYFSFQKLVKNCSFILTDSGGIQEESTFRQKPCLTLRPNTERPVTVTEGSNTLLSFDLEIVKNHISMIEKGSYKKGKVPELWDGKATERILKTIVESK
ncbi:MAG: UDP-N-acetylglucosamine 2-epimerase (non-hydrolyzing) [Bacteroidota bacterium]|nr:UDP-N-acetylglucosamine 2-epimerase (non-hydrolyzing) [Bacteroidota bacterium]MDP3146152.1 UDP-N-acetylglucosamine 2-epimerase (non-hydrolyzing) [Bacteroidota bacterium]MDP3556695.1 UDP-N-acetylglucosamine 2-epimerase (non-hydrolyzing) [Bacteroidota bacterium]